MKKLFFMVIGVILILFVLDESKKQDEVIIEEVSVVEESQDFVVDKEMVIQPTKKSRNFRMGFSTWPPAPRIDAILENYQQIGTYGDIISEQVNDGLPWEYVMEHKTLSPKFRDDLRNQKSLHGKGDWVNLYTTPLNMDHTDVLHDKDSGKVPKIFKKTPWDDPKIVEAYYHYCVGLIDIFEPDYFVMGQEMNELWDKAPEKWDEYVGLMRQVRTRLKKKYPDLPISESMTLHKIIQNNDAAYTQKMKEYMGEMDFTAISYYPLFLGHLSSEEIEKDLDFLRSWAPSQVAFVETAQIAERLQINTWKLDLPGTEQTQLDFLSTLLNRAVEDDYLFVINWILNDFDELWATLPKGMISDLGKIWRDTGLISDQQKERAGFDLWKSYFALPYVK